MGVETRFEGETRGEGREKRTYLGFGFLGHLGREGGVSSRKREEDVADNEGDVSR